MTNQYEKGNSIMEKQFLTSREFAEAIGVHIQTLRYWDGIGKLKPHHKMPGGRRMYAKEQVTEYLTKKKDMLSISQFSEQTGVAAVTLRRWDTSGKLIPAYKTEKGTRLYSQSQVTDYFNGVYNH